MFVDFLISLWTGVLGFLSGLLPQGETTMQTIPSTITDMFGTFNYYIDVSPFAVLFGTLSSLLAGFIIYKAINMIFNWISGLL